MKISALIKQLQAIMEAEGDLTVVKSEGHEYWGSIESHLHEHDLNISTYAKPDGPKRGEAIKALVIS